MKSRRLHLHKLSLSILCCMLVILLAACQGESQPTPTPPAPEVVTPAASDSGTPAATRQAAFNTLTPVPTPSPEPGPTPPEKVTLVLWHSWTGSDADALARILGTFQSGHPNVTIETLFVAYNRLPQAYADAVYAGGGPDLILSPSWWLPELVEVDALLPLDDLLEPALLEAYMPSAVANMRYQDQLYGLPTSFDLIALYYNASLISEDRLPSTTNEMLALAQEDPSYGVGFYANFYHLYWGISAFGGSLFDEDGRVILDETAATAEFLAWLVEMNQTPGVFVDLDYSMLIDRFKKGEYAFFIDGPWSAAELRDALGDDLNITLLPAGPAGPARPLLSGDGVFFNPVAPPHQLQQALLLAQHLTSAESGTVLAQVTHRTPANNNAQINNPLLNGFAQQAEAAVPEPHRAEMAEVWGYTGDMIIKAINGVLPPEEAVIEATILINEVNQR
jgi:arabinogalactan oligomer / maltooligosaccharide transport system substrate-binding protein